MRQVHRWLSMAFTFGVLANLVAVARNAFANWIGMLALVPLILLLVTGLFLFFLPHAARLGGARRAILRS